MLYVKEYIEKLIFADNVRGASRNKGGEKQSLQRGRLRQALHKCSLGSEKDRLYVKEFIKEVLSEQLHLSKRELLLLLPAERVYELSAQDCFELVLYVFLRKYGADGFSRLCEKYCLPERRENAPEGKGSMRGKTACPGRYGMSWETACPGGYGMSWETACSDGYEISEAEVRYMARKEKLDLSYPDLLEILAQRVYQELYGFSFCDRLISAELALDGVSAGQNAVYVMLEGKKIRLSFLSFATENALARVVRKLSRNHPQAQLSRRNCAMVSGLLNNARVTVARPPAAEGWNFYVRKFNTVSARDLNELLTDQNAGLVISLLRMLVRGCVNLVITGEQASGKTTLLKALIRFIDGRYSIRLAEGALEMHLSELYPGRNIFAMQEYGEMRLNEILTLFKKTDTDVTICGEINEPQAAEALIQISQAGGRFTMCTSHHSTTQRVISYMRNALLKESGFQDEKIATEQVVEALHFDIHLETDKSGHRYIERITEIEKKEEGGYCLREIVLLEGGRYRKKCCIGKEHGSRIRENYPQWRSEPAAELLEEQGKLCIAE